MGLFLFKPNGIRHLSFIKTFIVQVQFQLGHTSVGQERTINHRSFTDGTQPFVKALILILPTQVIKSQMKTSHSQYPRIRTLPHRFFQFRKIHPFLFYPHFHLIQQIFIFPHITGRRTRYHDQHKARQ